MSQFSRAASLCACVSLSFPGASLAGDPVKVKLNAQTARYCHVVRFPLGWRELDPSSYPRNGYKGHLQDPPRYNFGTGQYEFRVPIEPGLPSTRFLVRGFSPSLDSGYYTKNLYVVDLADPAGIAQPATEEEWKSARVVPRRHEGEETTAYVRSLGFHFVATGDHGERDRLSPDRAVLILQSWKGTLPSNGGSDLPGDFSIGWPFGSTSHGKLFFDAYSTGTGQNLTTVTARFSVILPEEAFSKTTWVTHRFFLIPLDDRKLRFLICDFGKTP